VPEQYGCTSLLETVLQVFHPTEIAHALFLTDSVSLSSNEIVYVAVDCARGGLVLEYELFVPFFLSPPRMTASFP
jgi:hypothetical protein